MLNADIKKSFGVILGVCLVCSFFVSTAAVWLHAKQQQNQRLDQIMNILTVADLQDRGSDAEQIYRTHIKAVMIDLHSGATVSRTRFDDVLNLKNFDIKTLAADPDYGEAIPTAFDRAKIKRRPRFMTVYLAKSNGRFGTLILPIYGKGLWSTIYGFLALNSDLHTIAGITFYEHGETPGLGGEIDNPEWQHSWRGKQAFDANGNVIIQVIRGEVDTDSPKADHQIDGLSGATLTSRGVSNMVLYWLGEHGYGPLLDRLKRESLAALATDDKRE